MSKIIIKSSKKRSSVYQVVDEIAWVGICTLRSFMSAFIQKPLYMRMCIVFLCFKRRTDAFDTFKSISCYERLSDMNLSASANARNEQANESQTRWDERLEANGTRRDESERSNPEDTTNVTDTAHEAMSMGAIGSSESLPPSEDFWMREDRER